MVRADDDRADIMSRLGRFLWVLCFLIFIAIKVAGTTLAAWSWWWLLLPPVPLIGAVVVHLGL